MNRGVLVIGGGLLLGGLIALYLYIRKDDSAAAQPERAPVASGEPPRAGTPTGSGAGVTVGEAPKLPDQPSAGSAAGVTEYTVNGMQVRDHRTGEHPNDIPPSIHPPHGREIDSKLTYDIAQKVRAVSNECAAAIPREARGTTPKVEGQIVISIKNKQLAVTGATLQVRDVTGDALAAAKQCMEQKSIGLAIPATDENELVDYPITMQFDLP